MRQRITDGAMNRCDANVGRRRSRNLKSKLTKGFGQHEYLALNRLLSMDTSSHSAVSTDGLYVVSEVVRLTCITA